MLYNSSLKSSKNPKKLIKTTKGIVKPAVIIVLHTFGRDLKFNPHFHVIVACGGFKNDGTFKKVNIRPRIVNRKAMIPV